MRLLRREGTRGPRRVQLDRNTSFDEKLRDDSPSSKNARRSSSSQTGLELIIERGLRCVQGHRVAGQVCGQQGPGVSRGKLVEVCPSSRTDLSTTGRSAASPSVSTRDLVRPTCLVFFLFPSCGHTDEIKKIEDSARQPDKKHASAKKPSDIVRWR